MNIVHGFKQKVLLFGMQDTKALNVYKWATTEEETLTRRHKTEIQERQQYASQLFWQPMLNL